MALSELFHSERVENSTLVPADIGVGSDKNALIYGEWASPYIGYRSRVDLLINPYRADVASKRGDLAATNAPGAFTETVAKRAGILALVDHDPPRHLARTRSCTLRLHQDTRGLIYDLDISDRQAGRDVLAISEGGDLGGMSFGIAAREEQLGGNRRDLRAVDLFEVCVVAAFPAYGRVDHRRSPADNSDSGLPSSSWLVDLNGFFKREYWAAGG